MAVEDKVQRNFLPAIISNIIKREIPRLHPKIAETSPNTDEHITHTYIHITLVYTHRKNRLSYYLMTGSKENASKIKF